MGDASRRDDKRVEKLAVELNSSNLEQAKYILASLEQDLIGSEAYERRLRREWSVDCKNADPADAHLTQPLIRIAASGVTLVKRKIQLTHRTIQKRWPDHDNDRRGAIRAMRAA